jgi:hypothetical protein
MRICPRSTVAAKEALPNNEFAASITYGKIQRESGN